MACKCGSQIVLCNLPIRFDTYVGCSHGCRYCFVQKKNGQLEAVKKGDTVESLKAFVQGKRSGETAWCDWNIPIHWGGMSDPFQPIEKNIRASYECLKLLAETKYPFVVSTKGRSWQTRNTSTCWRNATASFRLAWYAASTTRSSRGHRPTRSG